MVTINCDESAFNRDNVFKDIRTNEDFFDVTLACEDSQVQAHKVILSTTSTVLQKILKRNPQKHPIIFFRGTTHKQLENLLDFIYNGSVQIELDDLDSFMELAADLKIKGINQKLGKHRTEKNKENDDPKQSHNIVNSNCMMTLDAVEEVAEEIHAISSPDKTVKESSCIICQAKLSTNLSEIWFHYSICYYNKGSLFSKFPPGPVNTGQDGKPLDEVGVEVFYNCSELHCCYTGKNLGYKEFILHQAMCHRMLEEVIMEEQQDGVQDGLNEVILTNHGYRYRAECFKSKIKALKLGQGRKRLRR